MTSKLTFPSKFLRNMFTKTMWEQMFSSAGSQGKYLSQLGKYLGVRQSNNQVWSPAAEVDNSFVAHEGHANYTESTNTSISTAAANYHRVVHLNSMYLVWTTFNSEENSVPMIQLATYTFQFFSADMFIAYPFFALCENGDSITSTDSDSYDFRVAIDAAMPASDYAIRPIAALRGKFGPANGSTMYYTVDYTLDFTEILKEYFAHCNRKEIQEEDPLYLHLGLCIRAEASKTVQVRGWREYHYTQQPRSMSITEALK